MNNRTEEKLKDLSGMQKAVSELLSQAWERGYKYCEAEHEEQTKENPGFYVGDVVTTNSSSEEIILGLTTGVDGKPWASVYSRDYAVPQMIPISRLKYTGKHIDITNIFEKLFNHIKGDTENDRS